MTKRVTIWMQLPVGCTSAEALALALRYLSVRQWQEDGGTGMAYDPETGIAQFPQ